MRTYRITCLTLAIALFLSFWHSPQALHAETLATVDSSRDDAASLITAEAKAPAEVKATTAVSDLNTAVIFPDDQLASISSITATEMTVTVPTGAGDGDVVAQMGTGDSNGSPFAAGDSSTPDDTGIGTTWAITTSGTITSDTTWNQDVLVTGDVTVNSGVTLTVEPGVTVFFAPHSDDQAGGRWSDRAELTIWGALMAEGAATTPIYFTSAATQTLPGDWGGIIIRKNSTQSSLKYGLIQYAETGVGFFSVDEGPGTLSGAVANCTLRHNAYGLHLYGRPEYGSGGGTVVVDPLIANNSIISNTQGIVLRTTSGYGTAQNYATVQNNILRDNEIGMQIRGNTWWLGHADNYPEIVNNTFIDNTTYNLDIVASGSSDGSGADSDVRPTVENNLF
ncbi:MAG: hypothetical protein GVY30_00485, partial [Chloroflexi bacterium]|nr:hypothetical protein [Chloroflexota bacterium]